MGVTTNHWPDEITPARKPPARKGKPITYEYKDITPERWSTEDAGWTFVNIKHCTNN